MPKRISSRPQDVNQAAHLMVERSTGRIEDVPQKASKSEISRVMSAMGRKGGKIGGKRRLVTLTPEKRSEIAMKAAQSRWAKKKK